MSSILLICGIGIIAYMMVTEQGMKVALGAMAIAMALAWEALNDDRSGKPPRQSDGQSEKGHQ